MTFEFATDVVIAKCAGELRMEDARQGASALWGNPEWSGKPVVWDLRSAQLELKRTDVELLARFILGNQPATPPPRVAFVTGRDVDFGLARMFEVLREHRSTGIMVFRDHGEAVQWARELGRSGSSKPPGL